MKIYIPFIGKIDAKKLIFSYLYFFGSVTRFVLGKTENAQDEFGFPENKVLSEQRNWIKNPVHFKEFGSQGRVLYEIDKMGLSSSCTIMANILHTNEDFYKLIPSKVVNEFQNYVLPNHFNGKVDLFIYSKKEDSKTCRVDVKSISQSLGFFKTERNITMNSENHEEKDCSKIFKEHCCVGGYSVVARVTDNNQVCYGFVDNDMHSWQHLRDGIIRYHERTTHPRGYVEKSLTGLSHS